MKEISHFFKGHINTYKPAALFVEDSSEFCLVEVVKYCVLYYYGTQQHLMHNCSASPIETKICRFVKENSFLIEDKELREKLKLGPSAQKNYKDIISINVKQSNECVDFLLKMLGKSDAEKVLFLIESTLS